MGFTNRAKTLQQGIYISKVFGFTPNIDFPINADEVITGGTGYDIKLKLPQEIEICKPDYSIYPHIDYAIGFLTRGCPNKCSFCVVPQKEGNIVPYSTLQEIKRADSKKIVFMDNNVLAHTHGIKQIKELILQDLKIDFNQGLDVTLVTEEIADLLSRVKWIEYIRFSCDKDYQMLYIEKAVKMLRDRGVKSYKIFVYVLGTTFENTYKRIEFLRKLNITPFLQPLIPIGNKEFLVDLKMKAYANYVNKKSVFKSTTWENCTFNHWK